MTNEIGVIKNANRYAAVSFDTYLKGLAHLGLGEAAQAREAFQEVVSLDINHLAAQEELRRLTSAS